MRKRLIITMCAVLPLWIGSSTAWGLAVGANWDVHMDIPGVIANDFHVEGRIVSGDPLGNWSDLPTLQNVIHVDDRFPQFSCTVTPDLTVPEQNQYIFRADWSGAPYQYCEVLHLGLMFDETCHNIIIDLVGWWTIDGNPLPPPPNGPPNGGAIPLPGFDVQDQTMGEPQSMRFHNDSHLFGEGFTEQGINMRVVQLEALSLTAEEMETLFGSAENAFRELRTGGAQEQLPWRPAQNANGPISPDNFQEFPPDSFFDVFFEVEIPPDSFFDVWVELEIPAGGFLLARELVQYEDNAGITDLRWHWEIHEAHEGQYDLGDAPDSTNSHGTAMTAYPSVGIAANYPTVFNAGSPPYGPRHNRLRPVALLGSIVTLEDEADIGPDQDLVNNIDPTGDLPDQDQGDDCVQVPLTLPHCQSTRFQYNVTILPASLYPTLYVNVWFDFNRDGDWDDTLDCPGTGVVTPVPEWAVQNQQVPAGAGILPGVYTMTTPDFMCWNPSDMDLQEIWMRITLSDSKWVPTPDIPGSGGDGPASGHAYGETEDYFFVPKQGSIPPSNPVLRVGDWVTPEPWHNWIAAGRQGTPVQLLVDDPCSVIQSVDFFVSYDGINWDLFGSDADGSQPNEDTTGTALNEGDGWTALFNATYAPLEPMQLRFLAEAHTPSGPVTAEAWRNLDPTPPDSVVVNVEDWQLVEDNELVVDLDPMLANIDYIKVWVEPKEEEFKKGIPPISQQPHSSTHCAPTAAAACLKYYEGQGDDEIGGGLTDHELVDALAGVSNTNKGHSGTYPSDLANGLKKWISDHGDGYTVRGPLSFNWQQMRDELERCQDVLVGIYWPNGGGHRMTLNSIVNRPLDNGHIRIDFMDPWTGTIEYGELDPATGQVTNFESTSGNSGELGNIIIVCPKEEDPNGGASGNPNIGPDPGPIVVPFPQPGLYFLNIVVVDLDQNAHRVIRVVEVQSYEPKPPTPYIKWSQPPIEIDPKSETPIYCGWDEPSYCMESPTGAAYCQTVADDFRCQGSMPVTSIHWWGSYLGWQGLVPPREQPIAFRIGFWSDVPADATGLVPYSHPGKLLKLFDVPIDRVKYEWVGLDHFPERPEDTCFQYNVDLNRDEWFWQDEYVSEFENRVFWLSIAAVYPMDTQMLHVWGWKTRPEHWMDDGVVINVDVLEPGMAPPAEAFMPIESDLVGGLQSYDLAFELDTDPEYVKWDQPFTGIRLWPHYEDEESLALGAGDEMTVRRMVADDWRCQGQTPVTAITWWGSYIGYQYQACQANEMTRPNPPDYFLLSIWTDVPASADVPYSHPGERIWQHEAYSYDEVMVGFDKHPHDPVPGQTIGYEPVYRYSVKLPEDRWFAQKKANDIYWLSVVAVYRDAASETYPWGWTNHDHEPWNIPSLNPVGHWKLDERSGQTASDSSVNANHGTLAGDPTWLPTGGMLNGALDLDGVGDYVYTAAATTGLDFAPGSLSVSAWIHPRQTTGGWRAILEYDRGGDNWFGLWLNSVGGAHFRVGKDVLNSTSHLMANEWTLVTGTYDSTTRQMTVYLDGNPAGTATQTNGYTAPAATKLTIGVRGTEDDEYFDGLLDDVRIYSQALTEDEVGALLIIGRNDDAVAGYPDTTNPDIPIQWEELYDQTGESEDMSFTLFTEPTLCMPTGHSDWAQWIALGKPDCWCLTTQCYGDSDGLKEGGIKTGYYRVHFRDLNVLLAGWKTLEPAAAPIPSGPGIVTVSYTDALGTVKGVCADFAHDVEGGVKTGYYRVHFSDLNLLVASWNILEPGVSPIPSGPGIPQDCTPGTITPAP